MSTCAAGSRGAFCGSSLSIRQQERSDGVVADAIASPDRRWHRATFIRNCLCFSCIWRNGRAWRSGQAAGRRNRFDRNVPCMAVGDSGVMRALKRLLLKRRAGLESHLRDVASSSMELGRDDATIRCRKVLNYIAPVCVFFFFANKALYVTVVGQRTSSNSHHRKS